MADIAITIDGSDERITAGRVDFPVGSVSRPRRPLVGLAIAAATALLTIGATGPQPRDAERDAVAPAPAAVATVASRRVAAMAGFLVEVVDRGIPGSGASTPAWWRLPGPSRWVDPTTGQIVQLDQIGTARVVDHRARDR